MTYAANPSWALLVALATTLACGEAPSTAAKVAADPVEVAPERVDTPDVAPPASGPRITVDKAIHEFGSVKPSESVEHVFVLRNAGDADLKIEKVKKT